MSWQYHFRFSWIKLDVDVGKSFTQNILQGKIIRIYSVIRGEDKTGIDI